MTSALTGDYQQAEQMLSRMRPMRLNFYERFQEANFAYQASTQKFGMGNPMQFSWFEGPALRLLGLYHSQWAQVWPKIWSI